MDERLALIKDASEGKLTLNGLLAIATDKESLDRFGSEVEIARFLRR